MLLAYSNNNGHFSHKHVSFFFFFLSTVVFLCRSYPLLFHSSPFCSRFSPPGLVQARSNLFIGFLPPPVSVFLFASVILFFFTSSSFMCPFFHHFILICLPRRPCLVQEYYCYYYFSLFPFFLVSLVHLFFVFCLFSLFILIKPTAAADFLFSSLVFKWTVS